MKVLNKINNPRWKKFIKHEEKNIDCLHCKYEKAEASIPDQDMPSQWASFDKEFNAWKGTQEQIDDVCVMGVRIT